MKVSIKTEFQNSNCAVSSEKKLQPIEMSRVKWIVHQNKTIENLGCTAHTKQCREGPHFDLDKNIRINMPPCYRQKMLFVFEVLTTGFRLLNIPHVLAGGGVLGWTRNQRFIPYDQDLDMMVNSSYWRTKPMLTFIHDIQTKYGFYVNWNHKHIGYP